MPRERAKQVVKNAVYRSVGETSNAIRAARRRTLTVLMYHKVNDLPGNPHTVPPARFAEQMGYLAGAGYPVVSLDDVLAHYLDGRSLPQRAVLVTFDDGYRDNLEQALPVLERYGFPAVMFVPLGFVGASAPLPHDAGLPSRGIHNPTVGWDDLVELERRGVRVESHGISHRPLAELDLEEARREIVLSKSELEQRLGRNVQAFAYVKGSRAHYRPEHVDLLREVGYALGFTTITGANGPGEDPLQLRRYNVEPYALRTFELVLRGACDVLALKDTVVGTRARRLLNAALGTSTR